MLEKLAYKLRGTGIGRLPLVSKIYGALMTDTKIVDIRRDIAECKIKVCPKDLGDITQSLLAMGAYDSTMSETLIKIIQPNAVCVDIGANIGYFTLLMSKRCKEVIAYEPEYKNFSLLKENIGLNRLQNVTTIYAALSNECSYGKLLVDEINRGSHFIKTGPPEDGQWTDIITLDKSLDGKAVDLIKIDVQGAEQLVLEGARSTIDRNKDTRLVIEYLPHSLGRFGCSPIGLLKYIEEDLRMVMEDIDERHKRVSLITSYEVLSKYPIGKSTNLLCYRR